jgi:undecaprenyl-diphosphatase
MSPLIALLLGIIEGITEFLPISSTGHLILTQRLLRIAETDVLKSFDIAIQLGAILAVVVLYRKIILKTRAAWPKVLIAFVPTAVIGLAVHGVAKQYLLGNTTVVAWALFLGGIGIIAFEQLHADHRSSVHSMDSIPWSTALLIGLCQALAIIPGVSRAAATIIGGMMLGIDRRTIVDFSFLLAIPTMAAATGFDLLKSMREFSSTDALPFGIGFIAAFLTAIVAIRWLLTFIRRNTFTAFGIYRICIALLFLAFVF